MVASLSTSSSRRASLIDWVRGFPWSSLIIKLTFGYEEDSNPCRLGRQDTRSVTEIPDHFSSPPIDGQESSKFLGTERYRAGIYSSVV